MDEETGPEPSGSQSDRKSSLSLNNLAISSVNQLLESVKCDIMPLLDDLLSDCILKSTFNTSAVSGDSVSSLVKVTMGIIVLIGFGNSTASG